MPPRKLRRSRFDSNDEYEEAVEFVAEREATMWAWAWRTPQACAWSMSTQVWRVPIVAMWVRTFVQCEGDEALAADKNSLHRFADQIGLTTAGLREMGWKIAEDEVSLKAMSKPAAPSAIASSRRLRATPDAETA